MLILAACGTSRPAPVRAATTNSKAFADRYQDQLEPEGELIRSGYNFTIELLPDGSTLYKKYHPTTKQMTERIAYEDKFALVRHGAATEWYDNGRKWSEGQYHYNLREGEWKFYDYEHGQLEWYGQYAKGYREGVWTRLDSAGTTIRTEQYNKGIRLDTSRYYTASGQLYKELVYEAGIVKDTIMHGPDISEAMEGNGRLPLLKECDQKDTLRQQQCSTQKLRSYIQKNLEYPEQARERGIEGTAQVRFLIDETGRISNLEIMRGLSQEVEDEVRDLVLGLPALQPAMENGQPTRTRIQWSIPFRIPPR